MKTQKLRLSRIVMNFLLLVYAVFAIFPLIWMLLISFKSDTEVFTTTFLFHPTLSNYAAVLLESNYVQYMKDSLIVAGGSVLVSVVVGIPAAYALARHGNTRPVLVKRLVDMVRFEDQDIRLRAGDLLYRLYADKLITEEGVHLVEAKTDEEGKVTDYEYIGYKD